jgi:CspA family cold shock protein
MKGKDGMGRMTGRVKWYDQGEGHGFLRPEDGGEDVFVHTSAIHGSGLAPLTRGDHVEFERVDTDVGPAAEGVLRVR